MPGSKYEVRYLVWGMNPEYPPKMMSRHISQLAYRLTAGDRRDVDGNRVSLTFDEEGLLCVSDWRRYGKRRAYSAR